MTFAERNTNGSKGEPNLKRACLRIRFLGGVNPVAVEQR
jgi:hypothetical protein